MGEDTACMYLSRMVVEKRHATPINKLYESYLYQMRELFSMRGSKVLELRNFLPNYEKL